MTNPHPRDDDFSLIQVGQAEPKIAPLPGFDSIILQQVPSKDTSIAEQVLKEYHAHSYTSGSRTEMPFGTMPGQKFHELIDNADNKAVIIFAHHESNGGLVTLFGDMSALIWQSMPAKIGSKALVPAHFRLVLPDAVNLKGLQALTTDPYLEADENLSDEIWSRARGDVSHLQPLIEEISHEVNLWLDWLPASLSPIESDQHGEPKAPVVIYPWFEYLNTPDFVDCDPLAEYARELLCFVLAKDGISPDDLIEAEIYGRTFNPKGGERPAHMVMGSNHQGADNEFLIEERWDRFFKAAFEHPQCPLPPKAQFAYSEDGDSELLLEMDPDYLKEMSSHEWLEAVQRVEAMGLPMPE